MDIREYLRILRRSWPLVVASVLIAVLFAALASLVSKPTYTSTTQLFVAIQNSGSVTELQQGNTFTQARIQSYVKTADTPAVLQPVIDSLGLDIRPAELADQVDTSADLNTVLITVSASAPSPVEAASIAQAVADSLIDVVSQLEGSAQGGDSPVKLSVITPATAPSVPSSPNFKLNLAAGALIGLILGIGVALLRSVLDQKIRTESDVRKIIDSPFLGGIAYDREAAPRPLLSDATDQSPRAESFRQIRTNLQFANVARTSKSVLVTSSLPGEGKTTTASNMAIAMAQAGQRVVLVDADLRRPMIAEYLGLEGTAGLTTALLGSAHVEDLLQPWGEGDLYVLTSGRIPPNPSELLGSTAMSDLIAHLETVFDTVIIDAPPLVPVTDATVLAQRVGGVVVVVGAGKIKTHDLEKSAASLSLVSANVLGVVMNLLPVKGPDAYAQNYYSYQAHSENVQRHGPRASRKSMNGSHARVARRGPRKSSDYGDLIR